MVERTAPASPTPSSNAMDAGWSNPNSKPSSSRSQVPTVCGDRNVVKQTVSLRWFVTANLKGCQPTQTNSLLYISTRFRFQQKPDVNQVKNRTKYSHHYDQKTAVGKATVTDDSKQYCRRQRAQPLADCNS